MKELVGVRAKHIAIKKIKTMKIKIQKTQKNVP